MKVEALIYDLDGTLIDSAHTVTKILNAMREERGQAPLPPECFVPWMSVGGEEMIAMALDETNPEAIQEDLLAFRQTYLNMPTPEESLYPGVREVLTRLSDRDYKLGLCTNKPRILVEKILSETGLEWFFAVVQAGGDTVAKKPHPDTLVSCMKQLGSSSRNTLLIGDSTTDQRLAEQCGVDFVFFSEGYDDGVNRFKVSTIIREHRLLIDYLTVR